MQSCCCGVEHHVVGSRGAVQTVDNSVCVVHCGVRYVVSVQKDNDPVMV